MKSLQVTTKQLVDWVKSKITDDTTPMSERADYELFVRLMQRRKELKTAENRQLNKLSKDLEERYREEREVGLKEWIVSTKELCYLFDRNRKTISEWVKHGMPQHKRGQFDLKIVHDWWVENIYRAPEEQGDDSITEWRRRERKAKAQQEELKLGEMEKRFILREDHDQVFNLACTELRNTMLSWPSRLFPTDDGNRQALRAEVIEMLESFNRAQRFIDDRIEPVITKAKAKKAAVKKVVKKAVKKVATKSKKK